MRFRTSTLSLALLGALALPSQGLASGINTTSYAPLKQVSLEASKARADMQVVLLNVSANQSKLKRAKENADNAASRYGMDSNDYALAVAHLNELKRETLAKTLDELERSERRLATTETNTKQQVQTLLNSPSAFKALTKAHLSGQRTPEVTALLLHLAIRKLHLRCQDMMGRALVGQLEGDMSELEAILGMIDQLDQGSDEGTSNSIDAMWESLMDGTGSDFETGGTVDDLDAMLSAY